MQQLEQLANETPIPIGWISRHTFWATDGESNAIVGPLVAPQKRRCDDRMPRVARILDQRAISPRGQGEILRM